MRPEWHRATSLAPVLLGLCFGLCIAMAAGSAASGDQKANAHPPQIYALDEGSTPLSIDDAARLRSSFRPVASMPTTNRNVERWYRFTVPKADNGPLVLAAEDSTAEADLYYPRANGSYGLTRFGMGVPYDARKYPATSPALALTLPLRPGMEVYVRAYGPPRAPTVLPQRHFDDLDASIERWTFAFAGFLFAIAMSSLFVAVYLRETAFALQAVLMGASLLFTLIDSDLAWKYLWPFASVDSTLASNVVFIGYLFVLIWFSRSFLSLGQHRRSIGFVIWASFALNVIVTFVAAPLWPDAKPLDAVTPAINFLPFPLLLIASILRWRDGFRSARFFTIGLGGMIGIFLAGGLFQEMPFARWAFDLGVAFDSLFFQFAVGDRLLTANRARDDAQKKALAVQDQLVKTQEEALATLERHNKAFTRFVPHEFLTLLERDDILSVELGDHVEREMVVLFSDIRSFTALSEKLTPIESFEFVNAFLSHIGPVVKRHGGFVDKFIGDGVLALFPGAPDDALDAAIGFHEEVRRFNEKRARALLNPIAVGVGVHRGILTLGTIGEGDRLETTVIAGVVNVASRLEELTKTFGAHIVTTGAVVRTLKHPERYHIRPLGSVAVVGLSAELDVFEVCDSDEPELLLAKMADAQTFARGVLAFADEKYEAAFAAFAEVTERNADDRGAVYYRDWAARKKSEGKTTRLRSS